MNPFTIDSPVIDPRGLTASQLAGRACLLCEKTVPLPRTLVGQFPDGQAALVCDDHDLAAVVAR
jgi:hypothetical protein